MAAGRIHALIPAAGGSLRFGGDQPKQYALLKGRPVLAHSIEALRGHPRVAAVHVALAPGDRYFQELLGKEFADVALLEGGASRAESVLNGLRHIAKADHQCDWVLVHDAARPCLSRTALDRLLEQGLASPDGGILAVPLVDTIKQGKNGHIQSTVDRSMLWAAQTPQLFPINPLIGALAAMLHHSGSPTDEASAMEHAGYTPLLIEGDRSNIKVTHASDLALAEYYLAQRNGG